VTPLDPVQDENNDSLRRRYNFEAVSYGPKTKIVLRAYQITGIDRNISVHGFERREEQQFKSCNK
jgi:hypothetical protein